MTKNSNTAIWVVGLGGLAYLLYKNRAQIGGALNNVSNSINFPLPSTIAGSYFVPTPQGTYSVDPSGVHVTGGIRPLPNPTPVPPGNAGGGNLS